MFFILNIKRVKGYGYKKMGMYYLPEYGMKGWLGLKPGNKEDVYSHKGKKLEKHLCNTADLVRFIASEFGLSVTPEEEKAVVLHDIAKSHPEFRRKLETGRGRFGHAEPSSALVFNCTRDILCAEAVRQHHTRLRNLADVEKYWGNDWNYEKTKRVIKELKWWPEANEVTKRIAKDKITSWEGLMGSDEDWEEIIDQVDYYQVERGEFLTGDWLKLRLLYSLLVTADRYEAAVGKIIYFSPLLLERAVLDSYLKELTDKPLADWRSKVREKVIENLDEQVLQPGVYTLTLPTGAGKTLIGLELAMHIAERFRSSGIIYVLPFISLVEQNADVARMVFPEGCPVLEDHYLSNFKIENMKNKGDSDQLDQLQRFISFFRYWQAPVVITTLAKMWDVLFSPRANDTMSFHRLSRAVVVLDEPQAIPHGCWDGFGKTLELLAEKLKTTFILMTATQPEIVKGKELAPCLIQFPKIRHEFNWIGKMTIADAAERLESSQFFAKSCLLVLNTRKAALKMYIELLKRKIEPNFLSRWVTPLDRQETLKMIKEKEKVRVWRCLVATQVIEAGIDVDFDMAFRDLGPLDCIIQVAGRCNRNMQEDLGKVYIAELYDENGVFSKIYDQVLIGQTRTILNEKITFDESVSKEIVSEYYSKVKKNIATKELWENICQGRWGEYIDLFNNQLLDEVMLIIDPNDEFGPDLDFLNQPVNHSDDPYAAIEERKKIYRKLSLHSVPVPKKEIDKWANRTTEYIINDAGRDLEQLSDGIWIVRRPAADRIYRKNIGFVPVDISDILDEMGHKY
jgi:CRISPR-associated endonuclease/helicase Cas3